MVERMETEHTEPLEILPDNIGSLPSSEAAPLLTRAASRIDIVRPKSDFWNGMQENLKGAAGWIEARGAKFKGRTLNIIATASLVTTMVAACAKPPETPYIPTEAPKTTEVIPTEMPLPTETPTLAPTPTSEPTPTEIPMYEGELVDRTPWTRSSERADIFRTNIEQLGIAQYNVNPHGPFTLISVMTDPETQISEHIWGFQLGDQEIRFRSPSVIYHPNFSNPEPFNNPVGPDVNRLQMGSLYYLGFSGFENDIEGTAFWNGILGADENMAARLLFGDLRNDTSDPERLANLFDTGAIEGFDIDSEGIVDLSKVAHVNQIGLW